MAAKDLYEKDLYAILGVKKSDNADAIKKQYRKLARELHPDKTKGDKKLEERFKDVSEAYEVLSDDKKKAEYDQMRDAYKSGRVPNGGFQGGDHRLKVVDAGDDSSNQIAVADEGPHTGLTFQQCVGFEQEAGGLVQPIDKPIEFRARKCCIPGGIGPVGSLEAVALRGLGVEGERRRPDEADGIRALSQRRWRYS